MKGDLVFLLCQGQRARSRESLAAGQSQPEVVEAGHWIFPTDYSPTVLHSYMQYTNWSIPTGEARAFL